MHHEICPAHETCRRGAANATALAISSGRAMRPLGFNARIRQRVSDCCAANMRLVRQLDSLAPVHGVLLKLITNRKLKKPEPEMNLVRAFLAGATQDAFVSNDG